MTTDRKTVMNTADRFGWRTCADGPASTIFGYGETMAIVTYDADGEFSGATAWRNAMILGDTAEHPSSLSALTTLRTWLRDFPKAERQSGRTVTSALVTALTIQGAYAGAVMRVESSMGTLALGVLGPSIRAALILAEVCRDIAREDDGTNPMVSFARYAVSHCHV
jgi:hypothetical protein